MAQFSSRPPFNDDPHPNVWAGHSEHNQMRADTDMFRKGAPFNYKNYSHRPRPEYDRPQHNPTNPILAAFRENIARRGEHPYWGDTWDSTMEYLDFASDFPSLPNADPSHITHAREVLNRLVNFCDS